MKPYFDILIVDIITVSKSMNRHSLINSLFREAFFVSEIVFSPPGRLYFALVYFPNIFFFMRSNVDATVFFSTVFFPFLILPKSKMKSSKKHSLPTYSF